MRADGAIGVTKRAGLLEQTAPPSSHFRVFWLKTFCYWYDETRMARPRPTLRGTAQLRTGAAARGQRILVTVSPHQAQRTPLLAHRPEHPGRMRRQRSSPALPACSSRSASMRSSDGRSRCLQLVAESRAGSTEGVGETVEEGGRATAVARTTERCDSGTYWSG
jgi:hypothetical protein